MIDFGLIPASAVASGVFVEQEAVRTGVGGLRLPQKIALFGQYNSGKTPTNYTPRLLASPDEAAVLYGPGSMLHLMAIKAFAGSRAVPVYAVPIPDATSGQVKADGTILVAGPATSRGTISLFIAGQKVTVSVTSGDSAATVAAAIKAAIDAAVYLPVVATINTATVTLTAKWAGESGNGITIKQDLDIGDANLEPTGITLTITQLADGATDPAVTSAFDALGAEFFTEIAFPYSSSAALTALDTAWTDRLAPEIKKPFVAFLGDTDARADYLVTVAARNSPGETYVNVEGSPALPCEIAAAAAGIAAASAESAPSRPWKGLTLPGIRAGTLPAWTWGQHNDAQRAGGGTTDPNPDGSVKIKDLVTSYKTNAVGAADDSFRYPETIANIQAKIFSLDTLFSGPPFDRAVVVDDSANTAVSFAVSPKRCVAFLRQVIDQLWIAEAWSKERDLIMASIVAEIDASNAGRINVRLTDYIAVGLRIVAIKYQWALGA